MTFEAPVVGSFKCLVPGSFASSENVSSCNLDGWIWIDNPGVRTNYFTLALLYIGNYFGLWMTIFNFIPTLVNSAANMRIICNRVGVSVSIH